MRLIVRLMVRLMVAMVATVRDSGGGQCTGKGMVGLSRFIMGVRHISLTLALSEGKVYSRRIDSGGVGVDRIDG